ncbi:MAG: sigma-70 family RNA polymerase sigma factor [Terriglobales bacterium]
MRAMAGATTLGNLAGAFGISAEEATLVAELKAGSEEAYGWLIAQFQQPIYSLVYRIVNDPADASDTTQEVFLKVFRGMRRFNGRSSLKTWVYRIAVHEASNRKRWWFRHKSRELPIEPVENFESFAALRHALVDPGESPLEMVAQAEVKARVEAELRHVAEPFRTTVVLRDIEELSYEEIADIMQVSLGTVKSRLTRGRQALKKRLEHILHELSPELADNSTGSVTRSESLASQEVEVTS